LITDNLQVIDTLCKGCGICVGICPQDACTMEPSPLGTYVPRIDMAKCSRCMLCAQSCPAVPLFLREGHPGLASATSDEYLLGTCVKSYAGYSSDEDLRYQATSGGIVTSLLLGAFEKGDIDSALVVDSEESEPFTACAIVTSDKRRILGAAGSKYLPVEFSKAVRQVIRDDSVKRIGVVGLPCHIEGIRRASLHVPGLAKKIAFTIGLFCKQTKDRRFIDLILAKMGMTRKEVRGIRFRGNGWPGQIQVTRRDGKIVAYPYEAFSPLWGIFSCTPIHCLLCSSPLAELADVSVGEAWLQEYQGDKQGVSLVVIRTRAGLEIVEQAIHDKRIHVQEVVPSRVLDAQPRFAVSAKKANLEERLRALSLFDKQLADLLVRRAHRSAIGSYLEMLWTLGVRYITSSSLFRRIFPSLPSLMLRALSLGTIEVRKILFKL